MKKVFSILISLFSILSTDAQIDTSYYMPKYPTGQDGLIRDIEAFTPISQEDKDTLIHHTIELTLLILETGKIQDAYAKGNVSKALLDRVENAAMRLHDFIPARSQGGNVQSSFSTSISYNRYFPTSYYVRDTSQLRQSNLAWSMDIGGYVGGFGGNISEVYGTNGGAFFGLGMLVDRNLFNLDFGMGGATKQGEFILPPQVMRESNNVHFYYGFSYSRLLTLRNGNSLRLKLGIGGYSINAGFIAESEVFRFSGLDLYSELAYAFNFSSYLTNSYYSIRKVKHYCTPFIQCHSWRGDEQSEGVLYNVGIRYSFESYAMQPKWK